MSDVLLEMRIEELKPYALYPHMRDDEYIELDNQLNYIKNIEDDLFNGTLYFEDGTTSNIDSALNEWINKTIMMIHKQNFKLKNRGKHLFN